MVILMQIHGRCHGVLLVRKTKNALLLLLHLHGRTHANSWQISCCAFSPAKQKTLQSYCCSAYGCTPAKSWQNSQCAFRTAKWKTLVLLLLHLRGCTHAKSWQISRCAFSMQNKKCSNVPVAPLTCLYSCKITVDFMVCFSTAKPKTL